MPKTELHPFEQYEKKFGMINFSIRAADDAMYDRLLEAAKMAVSRNTPLSDEELRKMQLIPTTGEDTLY